MVGQKWADSPEERITREEVRARKGGLQTEPREGEGEPTGVGRFLERVVIRELQKIALESEGPEMRFEHGIVVEDYGSEKFDGASAAGASSANTDASPVFDIVCYRGDVAWTYKDGRPLAIVPTTFVHGVIEVKRGIFRSRLERYNTQLQGQAGHLNTLDNQSLQAFVGVQYSGNQIDDIRRELAADYISLIGDINRAGTARSMTKPIDAGPNCFVGRGALEQLVNTLGENANGNSRN